MLVVGEVSVEGYTEGLYCLDQPEWNIPEGDIRRGDVYFCGDYHYLVFLWINFESISEGKPVETVKMRFKHVFDDVSIGEGRYDDCIVDIENVEDSVIFGFGYSVDI